jgi:hypothetical protein
MEVRELDAIKFFNIAKLSFHGKVKEWFKKLNHAHARLP